MAWDRGLAFDLAFGLAFDLAFGLEVVIAVRLLPVTVCSFSRLTIWLSPSHSLPQNLP